MVLSNASNYAVSQQDVLNLYNQTIIPDSQQIERQLNNQLFQPLGLQFSFRPQELSVFQEDEEQRSASLQQLVASGVPLGVAMEMLGFTLPGDMQYSDLTPEPEPEPPAPVVIQAPPQIDEVREQEIRTLKKWAKKRLKPHAPGALQEMPDVDNFKSDILTWAEKQQIVEDDIAGHAPFPVTGWDDYP